MEINNSKLVKYALFIGIPLSVTLLVLIAVLFSLHDTQNTPNTSDFSKKYTDLTGAIPNDYLVAISTDSLAELGSPTGFVTTTGDTIIPIGKYSHCWTDTLKTFAIVADTKETQGDIVAIDRNENILFDVYLFDNWPDEPSEGLFRVIRNGKIGYANTHGFIQIPCAFECAFPFENGKAKVTYHCELLKDEHSIANSNEWFYIDYKGNKVSN